MKRKKIEKLGKKEMKNQYGYNAYKPYYDRGFLLGYKKAQAKQCNIPVVSGSISISDLTQAFLDWLESDDCWINDKNGNKLPDAEIDGKDFIKYAEKYYH